ncbi:MAG: bestrophin family protein [Siphonobacter sp.]
MVEYNSKEWIRFVFSVKKADTIYKLAPLLVAMTVYSTIVAVVVIEFWHPGPNSDLKSISTVHSLLGFVMSMLLVFRTNSAYDRWWEGRKLWGSLVNNSRNLAIKLAHIIPVSEGEDRHFFRTMIPNYAFCLKNHLRNVYLPEELQETAGFSRSDLKVDYHIPNQMAMRIFSKLDELYQRGIIRPEHLLVLNAEFQSFTDICGGCERIRKTPIPFSYSSFLKKFISIYCLTLPFGYVLTLQYSVIPMVLFIFYVLASLEEIAEEIEDPFGNDANDLPTDDISAGIRKAVGELL